MNLLIGTSPTLWRVDGREVTLVRSTLRKINSPSKGVFVPLDDVELVQHPSVGAFCKKNQLFFPSLFISLFLLWSSYVVGLVILGFLRLVLVEDGWGVLRVNEL